jgi:hypothetical protein
MKNHYAFLFSLVAAGCGGGSNGTDGGHDMAQNGQKDMAGGDLSMPGAKTYGFVSSAINLPANQGDYAVDLNGDGKPDNQLYYVVSGVKLAMVDLQLQETTSINAGDGLEIFNFNTADPAFLTDPNATVDVYVAQPFGGPPLFNGSDTVNVDKSVAAAHLVGPLATGSFQSTDPKTLTNPPVVYLTIPLYTNTTVQLPLYGAWIKFTPTSSSLMSGQLNGGVRKVDIDTILIPALAKTFTMIVMPNPCPADATGDNCRMIESQFDIGGCQNENGTMATKGDHIIDVCEVSSNILIQSLLNPDVALFDSSGNWKPDPTNATKDSLSFGVAFMAAKATVIP